MDCGGSSVERHAGAGQVCVAEVGVGQPVAEGEEWPGARLFIASVPNVDTLAVDHVELAAAIPGIVYGDGGLAAGIGDGEASGRVDVPEEHVGERCTLRLTAEVGLNDTGDGCEPTAL